MFDIDCAVGAAPCLTADDDHGFEINEAEVIYWGHCPSCGNAAAEPDAPNEPARSGPSRKSKRGRTAGTGQK